MCQPYSARSPRPTRARTSRAPLRRSRCPGSPGAVRDRAHVAAALDVVLAAQRVEPAAVAADVAGQQREVDQRENVVDRVVVLGDAERPADLRAVGPGVGVRDVLDDVRRDAGELLAALERVRLDAAA